MVVAKASQKVEKYGCFAALLAWLPVIGDVIALALGLMRTRVVPTTVLMFVGKGLRYMAVAGLMTAVLN